MLPLSLTPGPMTPLFAGGLAESVMTRPDRSFIPQLAVTAAGGGGGFWLGGGPQALTATSAAAAAPATTALCTWLFMLCSDP